MNTYMYTIVGRDIASRKQVRGPQHNMLTIANVNQDIETTLKQDKSEGAMAPLGPIVATPVIVGKRQITQSILYHAHCHDDH